MSHPPSSPQLPSHLVSHCVVPFDQPRRTDPDTILADRYRIVTLLGRGGMGEVYRADDLPVVATRQNPSRSVPFDALLQQRIQAP